MMSALPPKADIGRIIDVNLGLPFVAMSALSGMRGVWKRPRRSGWTTARLGFSQWSLEAHPGFNRRQRGWKQHLSTIRRHG